MPFESRTITMVGMQSGMVVNSMVYRDGRRVGSVAFDEISEALKLPNTFVWLGVQNPDDAFLSRLQEEFALHELSIEDARKAHQRPKIETYPDSLFIVLKTVHPTPESVEYGETHFFVGKNYLITVRHGESAGYGGVRAQCEQTPENLAKGPGFALYAVMDFIIDNYAPVVERFEDEFEAVEESVFRGPFERLAIERLYELKRELLTLRNAAVPAVDICSELMRFHETIIPKELRVYFRDVQDHATRVIATMDHIREMLMTAMQVNLALVTVQQNEVVKRFSGWGAIFLLPTVIFSLYGMNFRFMPELDWQYGYPAVLGATVVSCLYLYYRLKKAEWI